MWSWKERERERERGRGGGSESKQSLPLARGFVFSGIPEEGRARLELVLSRSASRRRAAKRAVAYRPAVSIRWCRSLGFPTCLFLASQLSGPHEWRLLNGVTKGATLLLLFRCLNHTSSSRKAFHGFQKGQVHSKKHKLSKNIFVEDQLRGHHSRARLITFCDMGNRRFTRRADRRLLPGCYGNLIVNVKRGQSRPKLASNQALPAPDTSDATCCYWRRLLLSRALVVKSNL